MSIGSSRRHLAWWVGVLLVGWGGLRLALGSSPLGFVNLKSSASDGPEVKILSAFRATVGFDGAFMAGQVVTLRVRIPANKCVGFYLDSRYYRPESKAAREAFDFEVRSGARVFVEYSIAQNNRKRYFTTSELEKDEIEFMLRANRGYQSESWQRASDVELSNVRVVDCEVY